MFFPKMTAVGARRVTVSAFAGYDRRKRIGQGAFAGMENLTADGYPALSVRHGRGTVTTLTHPNGLTAKDSLIWVDGARLYVNGLATEVPLSDGEKQLIGMGAYLLIWPDKVYLNTAALSDWGYLERRVTTEGAAAWAPCAADGSALRYTAGAEPPQEPESGALWLDTGAEAAVLRQYLSGTWQAVEETHVALSAPGIGAGFAAGDAVTVTGCAEERLNGLLVLTAAEEGRLVAAAPAALGSQSAPLTVARTVPDMDFVVECGNRLWGCKYGLVNGESVNEIYASKLGDFKNWYCYAGLATDSYAASRGSDGAFTGAAVYLGSPIFFKEQCLERVYPAASGAHQITSVQCDGVKKGSHRSLQVVDGVLYYHGIGGVYAYAGALPERVSAALGEERYHGAAAGALAGRYYVSLADEAGKWHLFCYDPAHRLWHRQDDLHALAFAACDGELFCLDADSGKLLALHGATGTAEAAPIRWMAESGDFGLTDPESGYLQKVTVQASLPADAAMTADVSYDGGKTWLPQGAVVGGGGVLGRRTLHVRPRRTEQLRLRLRGTGEAVIYSLTAVYGKGSDEL